MRLLLVLAIGCAGEPTDEPGNPPDALEIVSFAAAASEVAPCATTSVSWEVRGSERVSVSIDGQTLASSLEASGRVLSPEICEDAIFELEARRGTTVVTASVSVRPSWGPPKIWSFTSYTVPDPIIGEAIKFHWVVKGAARVTLMGNGAPIASHVLTPTEIRFVGPTAGDFSTPAQTGTTTFTLIAENARAAVEDELQIYADDVRINTFLVHPPGGLGPMRVEITWGIDGESVEFWINGVRRDDLPTTPFGSVDVALTPVAEVELRAMSATKVERARRTFSFPQPENEPNDRVPVEITGSAIEGELQFRDVDRFLLPDLETNSKFNVLVTARNFVDCPRFRATLTVTDEDDHVISSVPGTCIGLYVATPTVGDYTLRLVNDVDESDGYLLFIEAY